MQKLSVYSIIVLLGIAAGSAVLMTAYNRKRGTAQSPKADRTLSQSPQDKEVA